MGTVNEWNEVAAQLGVDSIRSSTAAGSGHPTSSLSAAHLLAVLWSDHLRYDVADPKSLANDRFVLSKGHASPLMFSVLKAVGAITDEQLLTFRRFGSPVQGHPVPLPEMPWIDVATGSLGQGLPIALGMALAMKMDAIPARVWCLMGDSEVAEGSVWEAMENASHHGADNLIGILDVNRLGQRGPTMLEWDLDAYAARARSFGWHADRGGRPRRRGDRRRVHRGRGRGSAGARDREDREGPRRLVPGEPGGLARQGAVAGRGGDGDRRARRAARRVGDAAQARGRGLAAGGRAERGAPRVRGGDRDAEGVRRDARGARGARRCRRDRRRGRELDPHRGPPEGRARSVRRELHRRAEHARHGRRDAGAGQGGVPGDVLRFLHAGLRLHPDGRDQPREPPPERLARRGVDRRGRAVADGARGPGDDARRARLDRALPVRRQLDRATRRGDGRPARDLVHPDDP